MTPPITVVERTTRVGVMGHLDELERLSRIFVEESDASANQNDPMALRYRMYLASFLIWLRQRQRESVAGGNNDRN